MAEPQQTPEAVGGAREAAVPAAVAAETASVVGGPAVRLPPLKKEASPGATSACARGAGPAASAGGRTLTNTGASPDDVSLQGLEVPPAPSRRPSHVTKLIYAAPGLATMPFNFMFGMHGNQSYQAFGASISILALAVALARSFDVLSDPLMSYWTDTAKFRCLPKWLQGRRRPFMFFGAFLYSGALVLLMNPPYASRIGLSVYFAFAYTLFFLASTFVCIPYDALAAELSDDANHRVGIFFVSSCLDSAGVMGAMSLPSLMTRFATNMNMNDGICRPAAERADLCFAGQSCGLVEASGTGQAFVLNTTLEEVLRPLHGTVTLPQDPVSSCLSLTSGNTDPTWVLGPWATAEQSGGFCQCLLTCTDMCEVANRRTGFAFVGAIFATWFLVAMLVAVWKVRERPETPQQKEAEAVAPPQLVPRLRGLFQNRPFCFLLPAWIIESFGGAINGSLFVYFLECIIAPAHQTMELNGHDCAPSSPGYDGGIWVGAASRGGPGERDWMCSQTDVTALMGWFQNIGLLCFMPLWPFLATKLGKVETWLLVSFLGMAFEVAKLFVQHGQVMFALIVFGFATIPHGGGFLSQVIMTDIIDYDEYLTGTRNEASYFMFKSFIPKIILIPASAIPMALLRTFGYLEPQGGRVMNQPASVQWYIRGVCIFNIACQAAALFIKWNYPLRSKQLDALAESLKETRAGRAAPDPITGRIYRPMTATTEEQGTVVGLLGHFPLRQLRRTFSGIFDLTSVKVEPVIKSPVAGEDTTSTSDNPTPAVLAGDWPDDEAERFEREGESFEQEADGEAQARARESLCASAHELVRAQWLQLVGNIVFLVASVVGACMTVRYIASGTFAWVPTLLVVCVGAGSGALLLSWKTLGAAKTLQSLARKDGLCARSVERLLEHRAEVRRLGKRPSKA